jgi:hypothetical protein
MPLLLRVLTSAAAVALASVSLTAGTQAPAAERALPTRAVGYYDTVLRRVVMIGGAMELRARSRDGVWSWSGARWEPVTDSGPPSRGNASVAYDPNRRVAVFNGGAARAANDSANEVVAESWQTSPIGWRPLAGTDITARDHHAMVWDEGRGALLLFGGIAADRSTPWPSDTWELRADGWARIPTDGPPGRGRTAMAYDRRRRQVVLFGGVGGSPSPTAPQPWFGDTWVRENDRWRRVAESGPRARYAHGMVFDERAGVVLLYSGAAAHRGAPLSDMWQWDGRRWTEITITGPSPGHRYQPVMVYDRARARTVLYGGDPSRTDTWEWDGVRWTEIRAAPRRASASTSGRA